MGINFWFFFFFTGAVNHFLISMSFMRKSLEVFLYCKRSAEFFNSLKIHWYKWKRPFPDWQLTTFNKTLDNQSRHQWHSHILKNPNGLLTSKRVQVESRGSAAELYEPWLQRDSRWRLVPDHSDTRRWCIWSLWIVPPPGRASGPNL